MKTLKYKAYQLWRSHNREQLRKEAEEKEMSLSKYIGDQWKALGEDTTNEWIKEVTGQDGAVKNEASLERENEK